VPYNTNTLKIKLKQSLNRIFPQYCYGCHNKSRRDIALCSDCESDLPWLGHHCCYCSLPIQKQLKFCGQCAKTKPHYDQVTSAFYYTTPITRWLSLFKFHNTLALSPVFSHCMLKKIPESIDADWIIPMPLHRSRLRQRGYNQALLLAQHIQKHRTININHTLASRHKKTKAQMSLNKTKRRQNLHNAFSIHQDVSQKHIIIIDDVMTTGSSINELSRKLKQHGATRVEAWVIARAFIKN
jgi:ComF family protein